MTLPYGVFLTLIFEYFDVNLEFENPYLILPSHVIGPNQLSKIGFKENDLVGLFGQEARTKVRQEHHSRIVLETESVRRGEEEEDEEEDDDDEGDAFHIHVRESRGDEATSRGVIPGPFRPVPDVGEAIATSTPSFQAALDQLQSNLIFRLDTIEAHWSFQFQYLEAKVDSLSMAVYRVLGYSPPPPTFPIRPDSAPSWPPPPSPSPSFLSPPPFHNVKLSHTLHFPSFF